MRAIAALSLALLAACNSDKPRPYPVPPSPVAQACPNWTMNPLVNGAQYGPPGCSDTGAFTFPVCASYTRDQGMHTFVRPTGPLTPGATVLVDFEIVGAETFVGVEEQASGTYLSLFIQRHGDNWSGVGPYNEYRAYSVRSGQSLKNGRFTLSARLVQSEWQAVMTAGLEAGFADLLANAERVGVVFGTYQSGKAHGVCPSTGGVQFIVHRFATDIQ